MKIFGFRLKKFYHAPLDSEQIDSIIPEPLFSKILSIDISQNDEGWAARMILEDFTMLYLRFYYPIDKNVVMHYCEPVINYFNGCKK